jgi:2-polyprenyl-6-methoxyphenol hydroxylase-like FAD-dependent oxidoreductase
MGAGKVLINGAGIGGLALGAALGQRGAEVDIVELKPDNAVQGIGISVPANALRVLERLDLIEDFLDVGLVFDSYRLFDVDGEHPVVVPMPKKRPDGLPSYVGVPRPAYAEILAAAATGAGATISFATTITEMSERPEAVDVTLSNGSQASYDVVIGADGIRSPIRRRLFGIDSQPVYSGAAAWRVEVSRPPDVTYMATFQGLGSRAGWVPINEGSMYIFFVDAHPESQPEYVWRNADRLAEIFIGRLEEYGGVIGKIRDELAPSSDVVYSPFERVLLSLPWHRGRIAVIGDAAHAMSANISQGASSALEDAIVMAEELTDRDSVEEALAGFERRRFPRVKFLQELSHKMLMNEVSMAPAVVAGRAEEMAAAPSKFRELDSFLSQPL